MKGWTLDYVQSLETRTYSELAEWLNDQAERATHGEDSIDVDALSETERTSVLKRAIRGGR